ncbi:DUF6445 family protein [Aurantiacibacter spongiae]|uniref:Uncharacterized protein n=1 Tax=Aurantiacibacter spongiae TaxID=2488860 RepID=A0A3N5CU09_9SPHN|nr:DUF6445 family protein [Aurantiacibacter spongiae]RPF72187.1 hypothetical protein EG799_11580 [Aurantiacibacter spongiae]
MASTPALPEADVAVHRMGEEGEPLVVIDNFSGLTERFLEGGRAATYRPAGASYPGLRSPVDPSYLDLRRELMMQLMGRVFGIRRGIGCEAASFSLVTLPPESLAPLQRIPHHDHDLKGDGSQVIAVMHYLLGPESGGTAFYRHRRTGFETITPARFPAFGEALEQDAREYGEPPARYFYGDDERYELIAEVEARPDRLILYRGRTLHSGVIPDARALSDDPAKGRLTVNMFLVGS